MFAQLAIWKSWSAHLYDPRKAENEHRSELPDMPLEGIPGPLIRCASHVDEEPEKRKPLFWKFTRQKESPEGAATGILHPNLGSKIHKSSSYREDWVRGGKKGGSFYLILIREAHASTCSMEGTQREMSFPIRYHMLWRSLGIFIHLR